MRLQPENEMLLICTVAVVIILLSVLLAGCATPLKVVAPCPKTSIPVEPIYPTAKLKRDDNDATVAKAYVITDKLKSGYIKDLKNRLGAYNGD